ncbi:hypothetical protein EAG18_12850 [Pseudoalteromonas sp. J010]|nr:hypothetical protein EAG18_12850 [Pseudoalteromonas sp. J010]
MSITRQKFCYLVILNEKFLTLLASDLLLQIEQVLSQIGISCHSFLNPQRVTPLHFRQLYSILPVCKSHFPELGK